MTAFAAVFSRDGRPIDRDGSDRIAATLSSITGHETRIHHSGPCRLFLSPLHPWDAREPLARHAGGIAAAGQVMLEGAADLRRELGLTEDAPDLETAAAVFEQRGMDGARRLQGEYALAVWDGRERALICARDPIGVRVLYAGESDGLVIVSNTIDAIVAHPAIPRTLDEGALLRFVADGSVTKATATPYNAVKLVPEGHTLVIRPQGHAILRRHWHPPAMDDAMPRDARSVPDGYRAVLQRAVADRVSGRRATIFLSGGIDSTTIAATAIESAVELRAVTFRYRTLEFDDEVELATEAARHLEIETSIVGADTHVALDAERNGAASSVLADEPGLANWREGLARAAAFSSLAVYGEDGDALLAPPGGTALLNAQPLPSVALAAARLIVSEGEAPYLGLRLRERIGLSQGPSVEPAPWLTRAARELAAEPEDAAILGARAERLEFGPGGGRTWERLLRNVPRDFAVSLSPDVTRQRLAITLPLIDTRVIRYALSIPPVPWCHHKRVAREAFADRLPASVLARPKTPVPGAHEALVDGWRRRREDLVRDPQTASSLAGRGWIDAATWRQTLAHGSPRATMAAWRVLMVDAWLTRAATSCTR